MSAQETDTTTFTSEYVESEITYEDTKGSALVNNLFQIPVINDGYSYLKESRYGGIAVNAAGAAFNTASKITSPVQQRFHVQLSQVDEIAAKSVQSLGDAVPFIRTPTDQLIYQVKTPAIQTIDTVKSISTSVTTPVKSIATSVSGELNDRVAVPAKNLAQTVQAQITPIAKNVDASFEPVVSKYATFVESYFPEDDSSEVEEEEQLSQTYRVLSVSGKVRRRLSRRLKDRISTTQVYTQEQLRHLQEQNALLKKATDTVNELNAKLLGLVLSAKQNAINLRDTVQSPDLGVTLHARLHDLAGAVLGELDKEADLPKAVQKRVIELSQNLVTTTDSIATYVKENATHFPEAVQVRLEPLITFFNDRYSVIIEEIGKQDTTAFQKAKNIAQLTSSETLPILETTLSELQKSLNSYRLSFFNSFSSTTESVKEQVKATTARALGVK
jgi:hypothetical protein